MANAFTQKYGRLKGWQWATVIGAGGALLFYVVRSRSASSTSSSTDTTTGTGAIDPATGVPFSQEGGGAGPGITAALGPILQQMGAQSTANAKALDAQKKAAAAAAKKQAAENLRLEKANTRQAAMIKQLQTKTHTVYPAGKKPPAEKPIAKATPIVRRTGTVPAPVKRPILAKKKAA